MADTVSVKVMPLGYIAGRAFDAKEISVSFALDTPGAQLLNRFAVDVLDVFADFKTSYELKMAGGKEILTSQPSDRRTLRSAGVKDGDTLWFSDLAG